MSSKGNVFFESKLAGYITETDDGYEFVYDKDYRTDKASKPISLILPLREYPYHSKTLFAFFDGLIPEGWLLDIAVDHWKVKINDRFQLLLHSCRDTIDAVKLCLLKKKQ